MALLPKLPYINIERASKELDCAIDDLIDCWLSNKINFYHALQGERVIISKECDETQDPLFFKINCIQQIHNKLIFQDINMVDLKVKDDGEKVIITFKAHGLFIISPMRSTYSVQGTIKIISPDKVMERSKKGLLTAGFCHLVTEQNDNLSFDEINTIDGLEFPINKLFVMRDDINKFLCKTNENNVEIKTNKKAGRPANKYKSEIIRIAKLNREQKPEIGLLQLRDQICSYLYSKYPHDINNIPSSETVYSYFTTAGLKGNSPDQNETILNFKLLT